MRILSELTKDQEENLMSTNIETMLRESFTHDFELLCKVPFDDFQQGIRKFRILTKMFACVAHRKRIDTRVLGLNGEDERTRISFLRARKDGGHSDGTLQRESIWVLRQAHFMVLDLVGPTFLYLALDFGLVRRRRIVVTAMRPRRLQRMYA